MCPRSIAGVLQRGASGLPYYCTSPVCVPDVIGGLAVWRHNNQKKKRRYVGWSMHFEAPACRLEAHRRSGYMGATVSPAGVCLLKHAPLAVPMWLCTPILGVSGDLVYWKMDLAAIGWAGLAATHWVSMRKLSARRLNALPTLLPEAGPLRCLCWQRWRRLEHACDDEEDRGANCGDTTAWEGVRHAFLAFRAKNYAATSDLTPRPQLCTLP